MQLVFDVQISVEVPSSEVQGEAELLDFGDLFNLMRARPLKKVPSARITGYTTTNVEVEDYKDSEIGPRSFWMVDYTKDRNCSVKTAFPQKLRGHPGWVIRFQFSSENGARFDLDTEEGWKAFLDYVKD